MSSATFVESAAEATPVFIEVAPQDFSAQGALANSTATTSASQADQIARLTHQLQEAKEAHYKFAEEQEKIRMQKDQEIRDLKKKNTALSAERAEAGKMAVIHQVRAQEIMGAHAQAIQGLTGVLQATQAHLDEAREDLKALGSQMTAKKEQVEILEGQLQSLNARCAFYEKEFQAQMVNLCQCAAKMSRELEELKASAKDALCGAETQRFLCEEHSKRLDSELQQSLQVKEEMLDEFERLHTLLALCEERGDAAEQKVREMNREKRREKAKKVSRRLDFSKVQEKKIPIEDQLPAEPPLEKMPNFLLRN